MTAPGTTMKLTCLIGSLLLGVALGRIQVKSGPDVTLPTTTKEQKVDKVPYTKRLVNATDSVSLTCIITTTLPKTMRNHYWKYKGEVVKRGVDYNMRQINSSNYTTVVLEIKTPNVDKIGVYECGLDLSPGDDKKANVSLLSPPIVEVGKEEKSLRQKQGEEYRLKCLFNAYPKDSVTVKWFKGDHSRPWTDMPKDRVTTEDEVDKSNNVVARGNILRFSELTMKDRGVYFCKVESKLGSDYMGWYLRVLNPMAPIWPLIGIILEVLVVVIIIVAYEYRNRKRRQAKQQAEAEHAASIGAAADEVAQRYAVSHEPDQGDGGQTRQRPTRV